MSVRSWAPGKEISSPRGMWPVLADRRKGTPSRGSAMQNMRIQFGTVRSRAGTSRVLASTGRVTSIFNWVAPDNTNFVIYQDGTNIRAYDQGTAVSQLLLAAPADTRACSFAPLDVWTYFGGYDVFGNGRFQTKIFDGTNVDTGFRGPVDITSWTAVDSGAGQCTQGQHQIGFVYQNRTGYSGYPTVSIKYVITAATNASPSVLTAPGNNLADGQAINITGAEGNTAINGTRFVTNVAGDTFHLTDTDGNVINGNGVYVANSATIFNPIQVVLDAGLRQITVTVGLPALLDGGTSANGGVQATLFLIMTRADNPGKWYFIPTDTLTNSLASQPVPYNTPTTLTFVVSISDEDIASSLAGDTANNNFLLLHQDDNGDGPFTPNFVVAYGTRMCYGAGTTLYVSDQSNPQQITEDRNAVRMQNQRTISASFQLPGNTNLYLTGDRWMGYVTDNGDSPSTWAPPVGVSDTLGAPYPDCICAQTGGNWVWIVCEAGPYLYDGAFGEQPLTYLSSGYDEDKAPIGWKRVNWGANYAIQVKDDVENRKLYVAVPMDGSSEPNYMFCIDYLQGKTFDTVDISLDVFNPALFGGIGIVKEVATGQTNLWIGPAAAGSIRHFDVSTANDDGLAIDNFWESGLCRGTEFPSSMIRLGAMDIWARGNAPLDDDGNPTYEITVYSPDHLTSTSVMLLSTQGVPAALVPKPGITYMSKFDLSMIENWSVKFRTNAIDAYQELSMFRGYSKPNLYNR